MRKKFISVIISVGLFFSFSGEAADWRKMSESFNQYSPYLCGGIAGAVATALTPESDPFKCFSLVGLAWSFGQNLCNRANWAEMRAKAGESEIAKASANHPLLFTGVLVCGLQLMNQLNGPPIDISLVQTCGYGCVAETILDGIDSLFAWLDPNQELCDIEVLQKNVAKPMNRRERKRLEHQLTRDLQRCAAERSLGDGAPSSDDEDCDQELDSGCCLKMRQFFKKHGPAIYGLSGGLIFAAFVETEQELSQIIKGFTLGGATCTIGALAGANLAKNFRKNRDLFSLENFLNGELAEPVDTLGSPIIKFYQKERLGCSVVALFIIGEVNSHFGTPKSLMQGIYLLGAGTSAGWMHRFFDAVFNSKPKQAQKSQTPKKQAAKKPGPVKKPAGGWASESLKEDLGLPIPTTWEEKETSEEERSRTWFEEQQRIKDLRTAGRRAKRERNKDKLKQAAANQSAETTHVEAEFEKMPTQNVDTGRVFSEESSSEEKEPVKTKHKKAKKSTAQKRRTKKAKRQGAAVQQSIERANTPVPEENPNQPNQAEKNESALINLFLSQGIDRVVIEEGLYTSQAVGQILKDKLPLSVKAHGLIDEILKGTSNEVYFADSTDDSGPSGYLIHEVLDLLKGVDIGNGNGFAQDP